MTKKKPARKRKTTLRGRKKKIDVSQVASLAERVSTEITQALKLADAGKLVNTEAELDMLKAAQKTLDETVNTLNKKAQAFEICPQFFEIPLKPAADRVTKRHSK